MEIEDFEFSKQKHESTSSNSPILQRTSNFYDDFGYDSVSAISGSTIADSEFVANQIRNYELQQKSASAEATNTATATVYNLRIDKLVIDSKAQKEEIDKQIFSNLSVPKNVWESDKNTKWGQVLREKATKPKIYLPSLLFLIVLLGLSIGIPLTTNNRKGFEVTSTLKPTSSDDTNDSTESTSPGTTPATDSTSTPTTTTPTTTTPEPEKFRVISKSKWQKFGLNLEGKYKQFPPISKVFVTTTQTEHCGDEEACIRVLVNLQQESYPQFDDIRQNFLIDFDGVIYEIRGFSNRGESAITENTETSFDEQAISIGFMMVDEQNKEPNSFQTFSFCNFLNNSVINREIAENYKLFHQSSLLGNESFVYLSDCQLELYWEKTPPVVSRRRWNSTILPLEESDFNVRRRSSSKKVVILESDQSCDSIATCSSILNSIEASDGQKIPYNFMQCSDDLIFEGWNFDVAISNTSSDCLILLLTKIDTEKAGELFESLQKFLDFAVNFSKITTDYKIYCNVSSPMLSDFIEAHLHFDEVFEFSCR